MAKQNGGHPTLGPTPSERSSARVRNAMSDARKASGADQMVADADQSASDADQLSSDIDQTASDRDQTGADRDQLASDQDQATADKDRAAHRDLSPDDVESYESSRAYREGASFERHANRGFTKRSPPVTRFLTDGPFTQRQAIEYYLAGLIRFAILGRLCAVIAGDGHLPAFNRISGDIRLFDDDTSVMNLYIHEVQHLAGARFFWWV